MHPVKKANPRRSSKKLAIIEAAARNGLSLADLVAGSRVSFSVFYKVVRGIARSARIDAYLCRRLAITPAVMARLNQENGK